jgi:hypothetical protein
MQFIASLAQYCYISIVRLCENRVAEVHDLAFNFLR